MIARERLRVPWFTYIKNENGLIRHIISHTNQDILTEVPAGMSLAGIK